MYTTYKILSSILLSRLTPYAEELISHHQSGLRRSRSTTDHIFCIRQILEKWQLNEAVPQLFIDFKKAYIQLRGRSCIIISLKLVRLIKICWNETYSRVRVGQHLSDISPVQNSLKKYVSSPLLFNFVYIMTLRGFS